MRRRPATQLTFDGLGMAGQPAPRSEPALPLPLEPWPAVPPRLEEPPPRPSEDVSVHDVVSAEDAVRGTDDASAQDELSRAIACALAGDVVLRAGAGTGKTYTLVEVVVRLCAGATEIGKRVPPSRILGLTFS